QDVLEILPPMNQQQLALYDNAANVTVLTSRSEGIPNVLLESIACNTPFVATNVGGVAEIASPNIDYLVPSENADSLAAAVIACVEQPSTQLRTFSPHDNLCMAEAVERTLRRAIHSRRTALEVQTADAA
ncbi:MAG: glycosyltransferase, partial [Planctomycetales bacterium]|nr:glycosyltransferase [Planctomycetales bacterium]